MNSIKISKEEADFVRERNRKRLQEIGSNHEPMIIIKDRRYAKNKRN